MIRQLVRVRRVPAAYRLTGAAQSTISWGQSGTSAAHSSLAVRPLRSKRASIRARLVEVIVGGCRRKHCRYDHYTDSLQITGDSDRLKGWRKVVNAERWASSRNEWRGVCSLAQEDFANSNCRRDARYVINQVPPELRSRAENHRDLGGPADRRDLSAAGMRVLVNGLVKRHGRISIGRKFRKPVGEHVPHPDILRTKAQRFDHRRGTTQFLSLAQPHAIGK